MNEYIGSLVIFVGWKDLLQAHHCLILKNFGGNSQLSDHHLWTRHLWTRHLWAAKDSHPTDRAMVNWWMLRTHDSHILRLGRQGTWVSAQRSMAEITGLRGHIMDRKERSDPYSQGTQRPSAIPGSRVLYKSITSLVDRSLLLNSNTVSSYIRGNLQLYILIILEPLPCNSCT